MEGGDVGIVLFVSCCSAQNGHDEICLVLQEVKQIIAGHHLPSHIQGQAKCSIICFLLMKISHEKN